MAVKLTQREIEYRASLKKADAELSHAKIVSQLLHRHCTHRVFPNGHISLEKAICAICDKDLGWYCESSPKHYCVWDTGYQSDRTCIYCNQHETKRG